MKDLISIDDININQIDEVHRLANQYFLNPHQHYDDLKEKILLNFFFENSTRTRMSFEIAGKKMGAKVVNLDVSLSSLKKGESIIDTAQTINALKPDFVAIRHNSSGIIHILKKYLNCSIINAGDGTNEHPSQALLDSFVIKNVSDAGVGPNTDLYNIKDGSQVKILKRWLITDEVTDTEEEFDQILSGRTVKKPDVDQDLPFTVDDPGLTQFKHGQKISKDDYEIAKSYGLTVF